MQLWNTVEQTLAKSASLSVNATVASVCQLGAPSLATIDFSTAIVGGAAKSGISQTTTMSTNCTAPTVVQLTGGRMTSPSAPAAVGAFDNFISWSATATFGGATANLVADTSVAKTATSASKNATSGAISNGTVLVDIGLIDGNRLIAGSYSSTLMVTIDPSL